MKEIEWTFDNEEFLECDHEWLEIKNFNSMIHPRLPEWKKDYRCKKCSEKKIELIQW